MDVDKVVQSVKSGQYILKPNENNGPSLSLPPLSRAKFLLRLECMWLDIWDDMGWKFSDYMVVYVKKTAHWNIYDRQNFSGDRSQRRLSCIFA